MSNQRPGKWKKASMADQMNGSGGMKTVLFFKEAKELLEQSGYDDAAFYFEQIETLIREGNNLPVDRKTTAKALGI